MVPPDRTKERKLTVKAFNIKWDTDGDESLAESLPSEIEIPEDVTGEDEISDYLTDKTGFCHFGFRLSVENDETRFEELKSALFDAGQEAIEDFLGYEISPDEDKDVTDNRMNETWNQMPWEELSKFYKKYDISLLN